MPSMNPQLPEVCLPQRHARGEAALRMALGALATVASLWLLAVDRRPWPRLAALLGVVFGALWTWRFFRRPFSPRPVDQLRLDAHGVTLSRHGLKHTVPWGMVKQVELDHEALVVCLVRTDGPELRIEPGYGGLGLPALANLLQRHLEAHRVCTKPRHD